jgi:hypothetical protein
MSTTTDGGSWGGYRRGSWQENTDGDSAPFPSTTSMLPGSLSTPMFDSLHGPMMGSDFEYAKRESAYVPFDGEMFWYAGANSCEYLQLRLAIPAMPECHRPTLFAQARRAPSCWPKTRLCFDSLAILIIALFAFCRGR